MKRIIAIVVALLLTLTLFPSCSSGVPREDYDKAQSQISSLEEQIASLKSEFSLTGQTPVETAEKIVERYHETHIYSDYDFFVCADMALDVWDMLKTQGISALIQVGNVETDIKNITEANHAWVLAETSPGRYLALETTGGYVVWSDDRYYKGWSFENPRTYKRFVELKQEYNLRISIMEQMKEPFVNAGIAGEKAVNEFSQLSNRISGKSLYDPSLAYDIMGIILQSKDCGYYIGKSEQLVESMNEQLTKIENIVSEMKSLIQ